MVFWSIVHHSLTHSYVYLIILLSLAVLANVLARAKRNQTPSKAKQLRPNEKAVIGAVIECDKQAKLIN